MIRGACRAAAISAAALALGGGAVRAQTTTGVATAAFRNDVHAAAGLTCAACHDGNQPNRGASRPAAGASGSGTYVAPARMAIAPLCATCHSDAAYMRQFDPQERIDQFLQYQTSTHGRRMAAGESRTATCTDCHGAHGVRRVSDPQSPVAPINVTATCRRCHADQARMKAFGRDPSIPADWAESVHAAALVKRGDTSAPTCAACHGSHGATPPGVTSVANICAQCHLREAELFRASPKKFIFDAIGQAECLVCHSNHRIEPPADHWIGVEEGTVCAQCHDGSGDSGATIRELRETLDRLSTALREADAVLGRAERAGMPVDDGRLALRSARDLQVQSRVLVHGFAAAPFAKTAAEGFANAQRAREAGEAAMREIQVRRRGLTVSIILILAFLATLWFKIRRLPL